MLHHGSVGVSSEYNKGNLTLTLTLNLLLLLPSIVFYDKICVYHDFYGFNIFTAYLLHEEVMSVRLYARLAIITLRFIIKKMNVFQMHLQ